MGLVTQTHWHTTSVASRTQDVDSHAVYTAENLGCQKKWLTLFLPLTWCTVASSWNQTRLVLIGLFAWRLSKVISGIQALESLETNHKDLQLLEIQSAVQDIFDTLGTTSVWKALQDYVNRGTPQLKNSNILLLGTY